jgi:hypothetical protein
MENKDLYEWMADLSKDEHFQECIALTDRAKDEQYGLELVLRFIIFRKLNENEMTTSKIGDLGDFLTNKMLNLPTVALIVGKKKGIQTYFHFFIAL